MEPPATLLAPELRDHWVELARIGVECSAAADAAIAAARDGDLPDAQTQLDRLFGASGALIQVLVGASLSELASMFALRERDALARYEREVLDAAQIGSFSVRLPERTIVNADENFTRLFGLQPDRLSGVSAEHYLGKDAVEVLLAQSATGKTARVAVHTKDAAGEAVTIEVVAYAKGKGSAQQLHGFVVNKTQAAKDAQQRRLLSAALESSDQLVIITDKRQRIVYGNAAFTRISGFSWSDASGKSPQILYGKETDPATRIAISEAIAGEREVHVQILNYTKSGESFWLDLSVVPVRDDAREISHWIAIGRDISAQKTQEQEIARHAMEDHLTGLINRRAAEERLRIEWNRAQRANQKFAIALVDIDRFKLVNDQYGHQVGDQALIHVSRMLAANLRGGDWLSRWGGEEFLMCFHGLDGRGALTAGERTRKLVRSRPCKLAEGELQITVSIGISVFGGESQTLETMLTEADSLLYEAKKTGRDRTLCAGLSETREANFIWEGAQIQSALMENRVRPAYQPIVDLRSGLTVGEEALARIITRGNEIIAAQNFIEAAESLHLVGAIDRVVSTEALSRTALGMENGANGQAHFINLSAQFLADPDAVADLLDQATAFPMLKKNGAQNPMVIEITERQTADISVLRKHLKPLMEAGFRLAVDDFGSGYSSFLYLASLPVDFLKIEGWMVNRIVKTARVRQLVQTIVNTAKTFDLRTVAECVEDASTAQVLCDIGVDWAQGHYFAHPATDANAGLASGASSKSN